ncbi:hypothetical protein B0H12DRAFT_1099258 [Mycena haematopus]|nr:hypothetical protein B0H12DRAFT_1140029 [Mycena haematopus]KAJ7239037.1 hypothetical protein B0H12DRAFT_1136671 [Mycena haematopus]KAJ7249740.1 hypothetical protein B0H12DRAFT_1121590 [Mycena haematopus]KAJ7267030.1 hypothetical protein B0H12DRAFT_1099258 [Mycena haematopus]
MKDVSCSAILWCVGPDEHCCRLSMGHISVYLYWYIRVPYSSMNIWVHSSLCVCRGGNGRASGPRIMA